MAVFKLVNGTNFDYSSGGKIYKLMVYDPAVFDAWKKSGTGTGTGTVAEKDALKKDTGLAEQPAVPANNGSSSTMTIAIIAVVIAVLAVLAAGGYVLMSRRRNSKAAAQAPESPVQSPPAPAQDTAITSPAPASPVSTPPAQARDDSTTTETLPESTKFCTKCGGVIEPGKHYCEDCGAGID